MRRLRGLRLMPKDQDWTAYAWLVYLFYFVSAPFLGAAPAWQRAATAGGTAAALVLYFAGYWLRGPRVLWVVGGFLALATVFCPFNAGASVFFVYGACYVHRAGPPRVAFGSLAVVAAAIILDAWAFHLPTEVWAPALLLSTLLGSVLIHYFQRKRLTASLTLAREEIERLAKVAERERIARDLHDLLGHTLSVIILKSELASRLAEKNTPRAIQEIRDVERISREALGQVRSAVRGYRSAGFEDELRQAREALETAGIRVETALEEAVPAAHESVFAMALREAVTNVVRHAHATFCRLAVRRGDAYCELEVADNGQGGTLQEGSGLRGMRERVEALGGVFECDTSAGTLVRIRVPV